MAKKTAAKKPIAKKAAVKKAVTKTSAAKKAAVKSTAKKTAAKKTVAKKAVAKKTAPKKVATKKAVTKKAAKTAKNPAVKKAAAKTSATKKAAVKSASKKTAAKKTVAKKAVAKKTAAKKVAAKKTPAKKATSKKTAPKTAAKNVAAKTTDAKTQTRKAPPQAAAKPKTTPPAAQDSEQRFTAQEHIVYPAHGVGQIINIDNKEIAGIKLEFYVVNFERDKMTLHIPTGKAVQAGMRKLANPETVKAAETKLQGRARIKRTMWSRRAQGYEAKINSGNLLAISEVVRDLFRSDSQPEQSYSERQLYEAALNRMACEIAVIKDMTVEEAVEYLEGILGRASEVAENAEKKAADGAASTDKAKT
ncbi:MAG: histone H1-like repetitive region-containing protein [Parvularculales bacterium]